MDEVDRRIVNELQGGFPVCDRPYAAAAARCGIGEQELLRRLRRLLDDGLLSRFGPMYHAQRLGGALTLCALRAAPDDFEHTAAAVNAFPEVAHNYEREHEFSMWFVLATETPQEVDGVIARIEASTGCRVYNFPKKEEFFVGLRFQA